MKQQAYDVSVHYSDGSGEVFQNVTHPTLVDDILEGTKILTFSDANPEGTDSVRCINFKYVRKYTYTLIPDLEEAEQISLEE